MSTQAQGVNVASGGNSPTPSSSPNQSSTAGATPSMPAWAQRLNDANLTDSGNAECLALLHGHRLRYSPNLEKKRSWLIWNGSHWQIDRTNEADRAARNTARSRFAAARYIRDPDQKQKVAAWAISSENVSKMNATLKAATSITSLLVTADQLDAQPLLAATPGGDTLDLQKVQPIPPDPSHYLTMALGCAYDLKATCPRWEQFLYEIFGGDLELIAYIQRAVGYTLTGDTREQVMFLCWGEGANGKSVFLHVLAALMGDYAANASFETFDIANRGGVGEDLAMLRGTRFVTIIETNEDRRFDEAKVKSVTGGDPITCRFLYANPFTYIPSCKIWLAMNQKPIIRGTDRGIWRRVQLIPFLTSFEGR